MRSSSGQANHIQKGSTSDTEDVGMPVDPITFDRDDPIHDLSLADLAVLSTCHDDDLGELEICLGFQIVLDLLLETGEQLVD